jgi:hypothetical protein
MQVTKRFIRRPELVAKMGLCATNDFQSGARGEIYQTHSADRVRSGLGRNRGGCMNERADGEGGTAGACS